MNRAEGSIEGVINAGNAEEPEEFSSAEEFRSKR